MANSFNISVKPEIAANLVQILSNASALATILLTDLPAIDDKIDILDTNIDAIISNHIPGTNAKVDVNLAAIDIIDGIVDTIKLKTDLIPFAFRGTFTTAVGSSTTSEFADILNITDSGKIHNIFIDVADAADQIELRLTIDDYLFEVVSLTGATGSHVVFLYTIAPYGDLIELAALPHSDNRDLYLNLEFTTNARVEIRRSLGTANYVGCKVIYSLDL